MKIKILAITALLVLSFSTCFSSPLNDLGTGQTALGLGTDNFYIEHKIANTFTIGVQNQKFDNLPHMNDIYGQLNLTENLRAIVGSRNMDSNSTLYAGLGVTTSLSPEMSGYASYVGGDQFKELQLGANYHLSSTADLNIGYYSYMNDLRPDKNGVNAGVTFKF